MHEGHKHISEYRERTMSNVDGCQLDYVGDQEVEVQQYQSMIAY